MIYGIPFFPVLDELSHLCSLSYYFSKTWFMNDTI